ncbi:hypothetical protein [Janibacter cremeus]|uniref:Purine-cytosine permease-like protein n=1 Tax=Janibacter cremeus TaxID=1285192 RepID=A0A852VRD8_9MICO|nr:hypothetical protein [Janibacter cremeus]NYF98509.1 purine-cytosine permease-like protein [Janibacter cremeus]
MSATDRPADTAYAFGVAGSELFRVPRRAPFIIAGSIIGTVLALLGFHEHLVEYLVLLGIFIPPLGGVIVGDYLARWRSGMPEGARLPAVDGRNMAVYLVASLLAWVSDATAVGIPPLIGIVVAALLSLALGVGRRGSRGVTSR